MGVVCSADSGVQIRVIPKPTLNTNLDPTLNTNMNPDQPLASGSFLPPLQLLWADESHACRGVPCVSVCTIERGYGRTHATRIHGCLFARIVRRSRWGVRSLPRVDVTFPRSAVREVLPHEAKSTGGGGVGEQ